MVSKLKEEIKRLFLLFLKKIALYFVSAQRPKYAICDFDLSAFLKRDCKALQTLQT